MTASAGGSKCTTICADCHQQLKYIDGHWATLTGNRVCRKDPEKYFPHRPIAGEAR